MHKRSHWLGALLAVLLLQPVLPARAEEALELKVKAAFLYNFARSFTWPAGKFESASSPLQVCVLEPDPFGAILETALGDKTVNSHPLRLRRAASISDLKNCHIVYSALTDPVDVEETFKQLAGSKVLTVHAAPRAVSSGVVRFFRDNRKVRFEINTLAAARENLELSMQMQNLAVTVRK